ncbi:MAG: hypothetical protein ACQCN3_05245 [Candidatus Bathyarchaeia archaeon]|jgi:hypothetical protein
MNSLTLKEKNLTEFTLIKELTFSCVPNNKGCVIVLADKTLTGKSTSDIIYIGKSKKPAKRIFGGYLAGYGGKTNKKINAKLFNEGFLEKMLVSWLPTEDPKATQQELLEAYKKENGNYPAWNIRKNEKIQSIPKQTLKQVKTKTKTKPAVKPESTTPPKTTE